MPALGAVALEPRKRGRPLGSINDPAGDLHPTERRVALMHLADASNDTIAYMLETTSGEVEAILKRPRVAQFCMKMQATYVQDLRPAVQDLNQAIEEAADRAFEVEKGVMEELFAFDADDPKVRVRALMGAGVTAGAILDRAGKRAPTKVQAAVVHAIAPQSLEQLGRILGDVAGPQAPTQANGSNNSNKS